MRVILLRHGQSEANAAGLLAGRRDYGLTQLGREQARACGQLLGSGAGGTVVRVLSSPASRCCDTAAPVAAALGLDVEVAPEWAELDYGTWDGRRLADVSAEQWARWRSDDTWAPPGGESLVVVQERVGLALVALGRPGGSDAASEDDVTVIVSHVSPIKAAMCWALGVGPAVSWRVRLEPAAWVELTLSPPTLVAVSSIDRMSRAAG